MIKRNLCGWTYNATQKMPIQSMDTSIIILLADKGSAMVIMDREDYVPLVNTLLEDNESFSGLSTNSHA